MTERSVLADAHAYADNCLTADAQRAFEARLERDPALRRRVETWKAQNEAIRAAYDVPRTSGRPAAEGSSWMPSHISSRRAAVSPRESVVAAAPGGTLAARRDARARTVARSSSRLRLGVILALSLGLLTLSSRGGPADPRSGLGAAGVSSLRAFGVDSAASFDFVPANPRALAQWLSPRFWPSATEARLDLAGWKPLGVRIVPGTQSVAAFVVWETPEGSRAGLLIEPMDAPLASRPKLRMAGGYSTAAWTSGGRGFAAVAPDPNEASALARLIDDLAPAR